MAKPMTPDQTIAALEKWKVNYREYSGWRTRTRPGGITDACGITIHHTGGGSASASYLKFLFVTGRPEDGIPGPLCNVATAPDGMLHLGAIGRANHAGKGSQSTLRHVQSEDYSGYGGELKPGPDAINGNEFYYGNEIIYTGLTAPTDAAYRTAVLHAAAICDHYGWSALSVIAHREHTTRKGDPGKVPMNKFRTDLAAVLRIGPDVIWSGKTPKAPVDTTPPPEDDVALTVQEKKDIRLAGWLAQQFAQGAQFETDLDGIDNVESVLPTLATKAEVNALGNQLKALTDAVSALAAGLPKA